MRPLRSSVGGRCGVPGCEVWPAATATDMAVSMGRRHLPSFNICVEKKHEPC